MKNSNPVWYKRQFDSASGYNGNNARNLKPNYYMIESFEMLKFVFNEPNFNLTRDFELVREFDELDENKIGGDILKDCEIVIGKTYEGVRVEGMLVKKLRTFDDISTIQSTLVCNKRADAIYALTNMSGEVFYFLTWFVKQ